MNVNLISAATLVFALLSSVSCYRQLIRKAVDPAAPDAESGNAQGNDCPKTAPWPCKSGQCLSFSFICDGREDCTDGYDEDKALCTAKDRPASVILMSFIQRFHKWLIPNILGDGTPENLAKQLTEERNVKDYAKKVGLTGPQMKNLVRTMEYARDGRVLDLIMDGMPEEAYRETYALFGRIVESGFLGSETAN